MRVYEKNRFRLIAPLYYVSRGRGVIGFIGILWVRSTVPFALEQLALTVNGVRRMMRVLVGARARVSCGHVCLVRFELGWDELAALPIHSKVRACVLDDDGAALLCRPITYNVLWRRYVAAHGPMLFDHNKRLVAFFRQNLGRSLTLTVRHENVTDAPCAHLKLRLAWLLSHLPLKRCILLYEKNAGKCDESGHAVLKELLARGERNIRFVAPADVIERVVAEGIPRRVFVERHTFAHYLTFFRSKTFIGTEAMSHALELRVQDYRAQRKLRDDSNTFVFLQHGVMYMISLDSPQRTSFQRSSMPRKTCVVVSSRREAEHFIDLAGFSRDELIVSGLPKFDECRHGADADRIVIMPTWRYWEFNEMRANPEETGYVRMIRLIEAVIPKELRDKVAVVPHPLFAKGTFDAAAGGTSVDELLRRTRVLITDYSSVSYDAFYRGAGVVFWWGELERCLERYGGNTHLMLDEESAFGPVCRTTEELARAVEDVYRCPQRLEDVERYRTLVEFRDGCNTKRLVNELEKRGIVGVGGR